MARATIVSRLIEVAETLLQEMPRSETFRRRAISTAYYAVFHQIAVICADCLYPSADTSDENYHRVYRALEHASLKHAFSKPPLATNKVLRKIGNAVRELQDARHRADYSPLCAILFPRHETRALVDRAHPTVEDLLNLTEDHRRTLATCLLFKLR